MSRRRQEPSQLSVVLGPELKAELRRMARQRSHEADEDVTMSDLVREAVERYLEQARRSPSMLRVAEQHTEYEPHSR